MEIWRDIFGYEGFYQISNQGNVRSLDRTQNRKNKGKIHYKGKQIKPQRNSSGYLRVELKANGKQQRWFVHRLVALHFVYNPDPQKNTIVNHIDNNPLNNAADNLEWTTYGGNMQHAKAQGRLERTAEWLDRLHESQEKTYKAVAAFNAETGEIIAIFRNLNECGKFGFEPSCVCECCKGKRKTHKGLAWRYWEVMQ